MYAPDSVARTGQEQATPSFCGCSGKHRPAATSAGVGRLTPGIAGGETKDVEDDPKTDIVVRVVRVVVVAGGSTRILCIVVPRAAAQHAASIDLPLHKGLHPLCHLCFLPPAPQQATNFRYAFGHMTILAWRNKF